MSDEKFDSANSEPADDSPSALSVERVDPSELSTVARILAAGYAEDPVHLWSFPKADTRMADAIAFFTFFLRRMRPHRWEVFATSDRSAAAIMAPVGHWDREYQDGSRYMPKLVNKISPVADYFQWIETFHPPVAHKYLEFIVTLPNRRSSGIGTLLLKHVLSEADRENIAVWTWSSNPRNLTFYRRHGFEIGREIRRDSFTPSVTSIWHPPMPVING
jgi:GNAT superfamily N-acetyltransferase